ncbi:hypothetical protein FF36_02504 [Frankia torreyi]|uniref:Uncharacterized protein n=1 Tax=Frankia torreyi TaxID=1856 RepID=A0A0D8BFZ5_9ACTN|nr:MULTISPECIES: hypothetical protein [Frankia]KJE23076.1 hypothetical protein FF36_02504 [Frankia torreyi]KQC34862.1 hypothetical protein UK82_29625 [Frankia sp. ACN1ag]KQM06599.1 hypothetical protein FF86_10078 [Frankia sp. CpI1-P]
MDHDEIRHLVETTPSADTVASYPLPDDRILFVARDAAGAVVASFHVPRRQAERFADGMVAASLILGAAVAEVDV